MRNINEAVNTYFPIVKWVWAGILSIFLGMAFAMYDMKVESIKTRVELEEAKRHNQVQDAQIDQTLRLLKDVHAEQIKTTEAVKNLNVTLVQSIEAANKNSAYALSRIDAYHSQPAGKN